jgi:hypothetical protein
VKAHARFPQQPLPERQAKRQWIGDSTAVAIETIAGVTFGGL